MVLLSLVRAAYSLVYVLCVCFVIQYILDITTRFEHSRLQPESHLKQEEGSQHGVHFFFFGTAACVADLLTSTSISKRKTERELIRYIPVFRAESVQQYSSSRRHKKIWHTPSTDSHCSMDRFISPRRKRLGANIKQFRKAADETVRFGSVRFHRRSSPLLGRDTD